jgi:uncharacterized membrane protein YjjB (DUF3815 family)
MALIFSIIAGILAALSFSVIFRTPRRYLIPTVAIGTCTWLLTHTIPLPIAEPLDTFVVSLLIASVSHVMARITRKPAQGFLIPGVIVMVPGTRVYEAIRAGSAGDYSATAENIAVALATAVAISFGLLLANWIVPPRRAL